MPDRTAFDDSVPRPMLPAIAFCYAGGASHSFRAIATALRTLRLAPHDYPGHGKRIREPLFTSLSELAEEALTLHGDILKEPYAVVGHSMGGWVAVELARQAGAKGLRVPDVVVVSASPPPGSRTTKGLSALSDDRLIEALIGLGGLSDDMSSEPGFREFFLPIVRADLTACDAWDGLGGGRIASPLRVLNGFADIANARVAGDWSGYTSSSFEADELPGGHFFLFEHPERAAAQIDLRIAELQTTSGRR